VDNERKVGGRSFQTRGPETVKLYTALQISENLTLFYYNFGKYRPIIVTVKIVWSTVYV